MEFTEKQLQQINDLVLRYKFCTLETQQKLQAAGFFEKVECNMCITAHKYNKEMPCDVENIESALPYGETFDIIPMPTLGDVFELLPYSIEMEFIDYYIRFNKISICYENRNSMYVYFNTNIEQSGSTEAACLLWLKLNENGFIK